MQQLLLLLLILSFILQTYAQDNATNATWSGCTAPGTNPYVKIGDPTTICLVVSGGGNWSKGMDYRRWLFTPTADEYSYLSIDRSYHELINGNVGGFQDKTTIHVESQKSASFLRRYYSGEENQIFPHLTAIINVDKGVVKGITWDDACLFCQPDRCIENSYYFSSEPAVGPSTKGCFYEQAECASLSAQGQDICKLNVHFVWTGSDVDGRNLKSFNSRYSAFIGARIPLPTIPGLNWP